MAAGSNGRTATMSAPVIYLASKSPRREELLRQLGVEFTAIRVREAPGASTTSTKAHAMPSPRFTTSSASREPRRRSAGSGCCSAGSPRTPFSAPTPRSSSTVSSSESRRMRPMRHGCSPSSRAARIRFDGGSVLLGPADRRRDLDVSRDVSRAPSRRDRTLHRDREPSDKAGAYAVQGRAGSFVSRIEGSYSGVMGLPLHETAQALAGLGFPVL